MFVANNRNKLLRTFLSLHNNLQDFKTQIVKIQVFEMVHILVRVKFCDTNFKLREFETRLKFFRDWSFFIDHSILLLHVLENGILFPKFMRLCPEMHANEIHGLCDRHHKVSPNLNSHKNTHNSVKQVI